ncbi:MAG TPA: YqgE/AlgH family protein [Gammaproteobacteria bacterium]|nr:YqgE/AlgH family protein [Gammaproteobacteria bacterium]
MPNYQSLQHVLLIAMPQLNDPVFSQSVVYLWEYNEKGATGIIINKPMDIRLGELLQQLDISPADPGINEYPVLRGGPVASDQGFIIRRQQKVVADEPYPLTEVIVSSAKQDLIALANGEGLGDALVALGCAGWGAGQLDRELVNNDWLIAPFSETTLFGDQDGEGDGSVTKWHTAAARAGIDLNRLSTDVGHA